MCLRVSKHRAKNNRRIYYLEKVFQRLQAVLLVREVEHVRRPAKHRATHQVPAWMVIIACACVFRWSLDYASEKPGIRITGEFVYLIYEFRIQAVSLFSQAEGVTSEN